MESEDGDDDYVPGPGTYYNDRYYERFRSFPGQSSYLGLQTARKNEWIGPEINHLEFWKKIKKEVQLDRRRKANHFYKVMEKNLIPTPGPGKYNPINVDLIQIKAPKYSFGRRYNNCLLKNKEDKKREKLKK